MAFRDGHLTAVGLRENQPMLWTAPRRVESLSLV